MDAGGRLNPILRNRTNRGHSSPVGANEDWPQFYHGEGFDDVNGDEKRDLVINAGWHRQLPAPSESWAFHRGKFSLRRGGAQMFVDDIDDDSDQDVISALCGHEWGLACFEQLSDAAAGEDELDHQIDGFVNTSYHGRS